MLVFGRRYYSSGLGRWINRDPVGEEGGASLYSAVLNSAIIGYDYLGLTSITYLFDPQPVEGCSYSYEDLPEVQIGPVDPDRWWESKVAITYGVSLTNEWNVACVCTCLPDGEWSLDCAVTLDMEISVNDNYRNNTNWRNVSERGTYGHEQRHVLSLQERSETGLGSMIWDVYDRFATYLLRERSCKGMARLIESKSKDLIAEFWQLEIDHANPDSPAAGKFYEPQGGVFNKE